MLQNQAFRLIYIPADGSNRVLAEPFQSPDSLVPIDHHVPCRLFGFNHHDRCLLTHLRKRCQQTTFPFSAVDSQCLVTKLQLVKLDFHAFARVDFFRM